MSADDPRAIAGIITRAVELAWREGWQTGYQAGQIDGRSDGTQWCDIEADWAKSEARAILTEDTGGKPS